MPLHGSMLDLFNTIMSYPRSPGPGNIAVTLVDNPGFDVPISSSARLSFNSSGDPEIHCGPAVYDDGPVLPTPRVPDLLTMMNVYSRGGIAKLPSDLTVSYPKETVRVPGNEWVERELEFLTSVYKEKGCFALHNPSAVVLDFAFRKFSKVCLVLDGDAETYVVSEARKLSAQYRVPFFRGSHGFPIYEGSNSRVGSSGGLWFSLQVNPYSSISVDRVVSSTEVVYSYIRGTRRIVSSFPFTVPYFRAHLCSLKDWELRGDYFLLSNMDFPVTSYRGKNQIGRSKVQVAYFNNQNLGRYLDPNGDYAVYIEGNEILEDLSNKDFLLVPHGCSESQDGMTVMKYGTFVLMKLYRHKDQWYEDPHHLIKAKGQFHTFNRRTGGQVKFSQECFDASFGSTLGDVIQDYRNSLPVERFNLDCSFPISGFSGEEVDIRMRSGEYLAYDGFLVPVKSLDLRVQLPSSSPSGYHEAPLHLVMLEWAATPWVPFPWRHSDRLVEKKLSRIFSESGIKTVRSQNPRWSWSYWVSSCDLSDPSIGDIQIHEVTKRPTVPGIVSFLAHRVDKNDFLTSYTMAVEEWDYLNGTKNSTDLTRRICLGCGVSQRITYFPRLDPSVCWHCRLKARDSGMVKSVDQKFSEI